MATVSHGALTGVGEVCLDAEHWESRQLLEPHSGFVLTVQVLDHHRVRMLISKQERLADKALRVLSIEGYRQEQPVDSV